MLRSRNPFVGLLLLLIAAASASGQARFPTPQSEGAYFCVALQTGDVNGDGHQDVATIPFPGAAVTAIGARLGDGAGGFAATAATPLHNTATSQAQDFALVDMNGDALVDAVVSYSAAPARLDVALATGAGFAAPLSIFAPSAAGSGAGLGAGDLDGDGDADVVLGSTSSGNTFTVLFGDGAGGLGGPVLYPVGATKAPAARLADVDSDGDLDVLYHYQNRLYVAQGGGTGAFGWPLFSNLSLADAEFAIGDWNADGISDVGGIAGTVVRAALGAGIGFFTSSGTAPSFSAAARAEIRDLDGDGADDLLCGEAWYEGNCAGGLGFPRLLPAGEFSAAIDADEDGRLDVVSVGAGVAERPFGVAFSVAPGQFGGAVHPEQYQAGIPSPSGEFLLLDADLDGDADVVAAPFEVPDGGVLRTHRNDGLGNFPVQVSSSAPGSLGFVHGEPSSLNGDGVPDLLVRSVGNPDEIRAALGHGDGTFTIQPAGITNASDEFVLDLDAADLDGDGLSDLVLYGVKTTGARDARVFRCGPGAQFTLQQVLSLTPYASGIPEAAQTEPLALADLDGDGRRDLIIADLSAGAGAVRVHLGTAPFMFGPPAWYPVAGKVPLCLVLADLDADGALDLATSVAPSYLTTAPLILLRGDGVGGFLPPATFSTGRRAPVAALAIADVDGDGFVDATAAHADDGASILFGDGSGQFGNLELYGTIPSPYGTKLAVADLDGDGRADLIQSGFQVQLQRGVAPCPGGSIATYGAGCPGLAGFTPYLTASGCTAAGSVLHIDLVKAPAGGAAVLLLGNGRGLWQLGFGCSLLLAPLVPVVLPLALSGGSGIAGTSHGALVVPAGIPAATIATLQAFPLDAAAPLGHSASNGVELVFP